MKNLKITCFILFVLIISATGYSQQDSITIIEKNTHDDAIGLEQYLNATADTLILKNDTDILKVTFLNHSVKGSEIIAVGSKEIKIPLYHFKIGRYTIAVYTDNKIIAIGANRISNIPLPENAITDLKESILRSSLSEKAQLSRNIKPLGKKNLRECNSSLALLTAERAGMISKEVTSKPKMKKNPNTNQKPSVALASENHERTQEKINTARNTGIETEREDQTVASNIKKQVQEGALNTVKIETYNLSKTPKGKRARQSRKEYRESHLRPNGKKYDD